MINKVGIVTWHYYANFGSGLQAFALQELLSKLGYEVNIINYRNPLFDNNTWWKNAIKFLLHYIVGPFSKRVYGKTLQGAKKFQNRYLHQTQLFSSEEKIINIIDDYYCIVYGSDQIWAPNVYTPIYMGAYIPKGIRKISYAASIGLNEIPDHLVKKYKFNLSSFSAIAVREDEGKNLLKRKCDIEASVVLDPTLMIDVNKYKRMQQSVKGIKGEFIYCYFLNKEHQYREKVEKYAREQNLQIIGSSENKFDSEWMTVLTNIGADQFLWLINNAKTVFTDSYHGTIFSLLFHKEFWTFVRFEENSPICQNSRIRQLQKYFHIGHRVINNKDSINESESINYDNFERQLSKLRQSSIIYLENALK